MKLVRILIASALLGALLPASVSARSASPAFVLSGRASASAEFTLRKPVRLTCCGYEPKEAAGEMRVVGLSTRTTGTYAGFAIERVSDGRMMKGAVRVPALDLDEGRFPTVISFGKARKLAPGRYRIHLLTDGRATVRVPALGLPRDVVLEPTLPTGTFAELVELAGEDGTRSLQGRVGIEVRRGVTVVLATKTEGDNTQAHYLSQCLAPAGSVCTGADDHEVWATPGSGGGGGTIMETHVGDVPPGDYDAVFSAASAGMPTTARGFVLMFGKQVWLEVPEGRSTGTR